MPATIEIDVKQLRTQMRREEHSKTMTSVWCCGYTGNPELHRAFLAEARNRNPWM
ncbi:MAG: hypothetical protein KJ051_06495 [Thermoleophilia bacterium]|nr:hypothetical protein [Thermoleophilia bacterium]